MSVCVCVCARARMGKRKREKKKVKFRFYGSINLENPIVKFMDQIFLTRNKG